MIRHGITQLNQTKTKGNSFQIEKIFQHPKYTGTGYFDVAVLQIAPVKFNFRLRPICLPDPSDFKIDKYDDRTTTLIGWGSNDLNGKPLTSLRRTLLTVFDNR